MIGSLAPGLAPRWPGHLPLRGISAFSRGTSGALRLRVAKLATEEQKATLARAADRDGLDVSSWLRNLGLERARELERSKG